MKILVIQTAFLGDLLLTIPLLRRIKFLFPKSQLHLVCRKGLKPLMESTGLLSVIYEVEKGHSQSYYFALNQIVENLNEKSRTSDPQKTTEEEGFDFLFSPHESLRTAVFSFQIKAKHKISFKRWWNFIFFDHRILKNKKWHDALRQLSLLSPFDESLRKELSNLSTSKHYKHPNQRLVGNLSKGEHVSEISSMDLRSHYLEQNKAPFANKKAVCFFPGSVWATKQWPLHKWLKLGEMFILNGWQIHLMGGEAEVPLCDFLFKNFNHELNSQFNLKNNPTIFNFAGKTSIVDSLQILLASQLVITNDSAGQHLAAVLSVPTITIYGPTIPEFGYYSWQNNSIFIEPPVHFYNGTNNLFCRPCGPHGHRTCPLGTHECMNSISEDRVWQAVVKLNPDISREFCCNHHQNKLNKGFKKFCSLHSSTDSY